MVAGLLVWNGYLLFVIVELDLESRQGGRRKGSIFKHPATCNPSLRDPRLAQAVENSLEVLTLLEWVTLFEERAAVIRSKTQYFVHRSSRLVFSTEKGCGYRGDSEGMKMRMRLARCLHSPFKCLFKVSHQD